MKKKKKDLSIEELKIICDHHLCYHCPFFSEKLMTCTESYFRLKQLIGKDELNEEVDPNDYEV